MPLSSSPLTKSSLVTSAPTSCTSKTHCHKFRSSWSRQHHPLFLDPICDEDSAVDMHEEHIKLLVSAALSTVCVLLNATATQWRAEWASDARHMAIWASKTYHMTGIQTSQIAAIGWLTTIPISFTFNATVITCPPWFSLHFRRFA